MARFYQDFYVDVERNGEDDTIRIDLELDYWPATFHNPAEVNEVNREARWVDDTPYGTLLTDEEYERYLPEIEEQVEL